MARVSLSPYKFLSLFTSRQRVDNFSGESLRFQGAGTTNVHVFFF
uniref:Uncharacterized protein n=1 Tax=Arundo donax TaxID=35708 RepID=A0A0A9D3V1_ARUDO